MFKVGQKYKITTTSAGFEGEVEESMMPGWEVVEVDMPNVRLKRGDRELVLNVSHRNFVKAELDE